MTDFEKITADYAPQSENIKTGCKNCKNEYSWRNPKIVIMLAGVAALTAIVIIAILRDRIVNQPQWQVSVVGQGRVSYQPDLASVTLGVQVDKVKQAEEALKQMNEKMAKIISSLKQVGVAEEDMQTQNYSLYPQYDYKDGAASPGGYSANQQLVIKVKQINSASGRLPQIIGAATAAGANQVIGVSFDATNAGDLKQAARLKAMADARAKSGALAAAAGVELGEVVGWWENVVQAPGISPAYYGDKGGVGGGNAPALPQVPSGLNEVVIEVTLNYKVK